MTGSSGCRGGIHNRGFFDPVTPAELVVEYFSEPSVSPTPLPITIEVLPEKSIVRLAPPACKKHSMCNLYFAIHRFSPIGPVLPVLSYVACIGSNAITSALARRLFIVHEMVLFRVNVIPAGYEVATGILPRISA